MSTSLLYHAMGVRNYRHVKTEYKRGEVLLHVERPLKSLRCPACHSPEVILRGRKQRRFRSVPIGQTPVWIVLDHQRVGCGECGAVLWDRIDFAEGRARFTRAFARFALSLALNMCLWAVAQQLGVGWDLVKKLKRDHLQRCFDKPSLRGLRHIAIDEIHVGKGGRFLSLVLDLHTGAIVYVGEGKGGDALDPFWRRLKQSGARIEAVAMDMSAAYIAAVRRALPHVPIIFDHFHVVKLVNDKLTALRRELYRTADHATRKLLKGTRWLLLKAPANLSMERNEWEHLEEALALNRPLALAYYLKEELRLLWDATDREQAVGILETWIARAHASGIAHLQSLADTLQCHWHGLLAWFDHPIGTGPLEGVNNKIRALTRQSYGFRDREYFRLQLLGLHETRSELVGLAS